MHEANVQRAVKLAARQLGSCVLPHELRHAYASDCLNRGTNPRAIQQAMGHSSLETTLGYLHAEALSVYSPLDTLPIILPELQNGSVAGMDRNPICSMAQENAPYRPKGWVGTRQHPFAPVHRIRTAPSSKSAITS